MDSVSQSPYISTSPYTPKGLKLFEGHTFIEDLTIEILKWIDHPDAIKNCAFTCKGWNSVIPDSFHQRFRMRLGDFSFPIGTLFKATHWPSQGFPICWNHLDGNLFYSHEETVPMFYRNSHPFGCIQASKRDFICSGDGSMIDNYTLVGSHNGTYCFKLFDHPDKLMITRDLKDPSQGKTISIRDVGIFESNDPESKGTWCLPLSNEQIIFLSYFSEEKNRKSQLQIHTTLLDISLNTLTKSQINNFPREEFIGSLPIQLGNYFISNKSIIDLPNFKIIPHGFDFENHQMTVCGSSLYIFCGMNGKDTIRSYSINDGKLEKKWGTGQLKSHEDQEEIFMNYAMINEQFIALLCSLSTLRRWHYDAFQCIHLLNMEGEFVGEVRFPRSDDIMMHLVNDVLIYKVSEENCLHFWHIPTGRLINQFPWNGSIIHSIQSTNEELIFLTSGQDHLMKRIMTFRMNEIIVPSLEI